MDGGMFSNYADLDRWQERLFHGELLSERSRAELTNNANGSWTIGWQMRRTNAGQVVEKGGCSNYGFSAMLQLYPAHNLVVVMLFNAKPTADGQSPHIDVSREIAQIIASTAGTFPAKSN
jgi:CubicO group peptidase (beta-lactamase class C family)